MASLKAKLTMGPLAALALAVCLGLAVGAPASAAAVPAYGPVTCSAHVSVSPSSVSPGGTITVHISGNCHRDTFTVRLDSTTLGTVTTNSAGRGTGVFTVPTSLSAGSHTISVADVSGNSASVTIVVKATSVATPSPPATTHTSLPITGAEIAGLVAAAAAAIGLGGFAVLATRRRRSRFS